MITNERQYRIMRNKAERFDRKRQEFSAKAAKRAEVHPRLVRAERQAMEVQLAIPRQEMEGHERVKSAGVSGVVLTSIDELPEWLI